MTTAPARVQRKPLTPDQAHTVLALACVVRGQAELVAPTRPDLEGCCAWTAAALVTVLRRFRIRAALRGGVYYPPTVPGLTFGEPASIVRARHVAYTRRAWQHYWTVADGRIIDLTLTQFEPETPRISVVALADPRYAGFPIPLRRTVATLPPTARRWFERLMRRLPRGPERREIAA